MPRDSDWNLKSRSCSLSRRAHASHGMPRSRHSALTRRRGRKLACSGPAGGAGSCAAVCQWTRIPSLVQVAFLPIKMRSKSALYSEAIMMLTVTHDSTLRKSHNALSNLKLGYCCFLPPRDSHCLLPLPVARDRVVSCMPNSASMSATRQRGRYS